MPSHTVSVAVSDGEGTTSDVVVAYERDGESWRSWGTLPAGGAQLNGINWSRAGGGMPSPADGPTDSFSFNKYEGWPTVLGFQDVQGYGDPALSRYFLYVTKFGSTHNGSTLSSGDTYFSTDVAVLRSTDGGATFDDAERLTSPPPAESGIAHWRIEFPTASNSTGYLFVSAYIIVAWKQTPVMTNGSLGTPEWKARFVGADYGQGGNIVPDPAYYEPFTLPVPGTSGPISVSSDYPNSDLVRVTYPTAHTMELDSDGVSWKASSRCPDPTYDAIENTWIYLTTDCTVSTSVSCSSPTSENIYTDEEWRICVGASRDAMTGTVYNKQLIQPRMVVDPVTKDVYVAITTNAGDKDKRSRARIYKKEGTNAFAQIFETPASTDDVQHDEWAPALAVYHYPEEDVKILLSRRSTFYDTTSTTRNEYINHLASISLDDGANWNSSSGWYMDGLTSPVSVQDWLGAYDGVFGVPHLTTGFVAGWGDPRNGNSTVYGATLYP